MHWRTFECCGARTTIGVEFVRPSVHLGSLKVGIELTQVLSRMADERSGFTIIITLISLLFYLANQDLILNLFVFVVCRLYQ